MKSFFIFALCSFSLLVNAQVLDNELWIDAGIGYSPFKNADIDLETGYRRDQDFGNSKVFYLEPQFEYEFIKNFKAAVSYRYSNLPDPVNDTENRLAFGLSYKIDLGKLDISYRFKYQEDFLSDGSKEPAIRNKIKFDYNLSKKIDPFIAAEIYYDNRTGQKEFDQFRTQIGFELDLPKGKSLDVFYMNRNKFNVGNPGNINVFGLSFSFGKIKNQKKDKEK